MAVVVGEVRVLSSSWCKQEMPSLKGKAGALGEVGAVSGVQYVVVGGERCWKTWVGSQWSRLLKTALMTGDGGEMGGKRRRERQWTSDCQHQLPQGIRMAKSGCLGGILGEEWVESVDDLEWTLVVGSAVLGST